MLQVSGECPLTVSRAIAKGRPGFAGNKTPLHQLIALILHISKTSLSYTQRPFGCCQRHFGDTRTNHGRSSCGLHKEWGDINTTPENKRGRRLANVHTRISELREPFNGVDFWACTSDREGREQDRKYQTVPSQRSVYTPIVAIIAVYSPNERKDYYLRKTLHIMRSRRFLNLPYASTLSPQKVPGQCAGSTTIASGMEGLKTCFVLRM